MLRRYVPVVRRRVGVVVLGLTIGVLSAGSAHAQQKSPYAFAGDNAIFMNFIKADQTGAYEELVAKLKEGLQKSDKPERKQMAESWKIYKAAEPGPNGSVIYVSIITPVVKGQDYSIVTLLGEAFPTDARALYDKYVAAFTTPPGQLFNLSLLNDLSK
ncbi:MAG: hypothetical protein JSU08_12440 [Acidobacteria bacterium]|nr:hypothetical protein [Acidobacteriota bacterium]